MSTKEILTKQFQAKAKKEKITIPKKNIEIVYKSCVDFSESLILEKPNLADYKDELIQNKFNCIMFNLHKDNKDLIKLLKSTKDKSLNSIATMSEKELDSSKWKNEITNEEFIEKLKEAQASNVFVCKRCRGTKCRVYEKQTRSADEPMTIFINCLTCGHTKKC